MKTFIFFVALSSIYQEIKSSLNKSENLVLRSIDKKDAGATDKPIYNTHSEFVKITSPIRTSSNLIRPAREQVQMTTNCIIPRNKRIFTGDRSLNKIQLMRPSNAFNPNSSNFKYNKHGDFGSKTSLEAFVIGVTTGVAIFGLLVAVVVSKFFLFPLMIVRLLSLFLIQQDSLPAPSAIIGKLFSQDQL